MKLFDRTIYALITAILALWALAAVLLPSVASAGLERMTLLPGDGACFAVVSIENRAGRVARCSSKRSRKTPGLAIPVFPSF